MILTFRVHFPSFCSKLQDSSIHLPACSNAAYFCKLLVLKKNACSVCGWTRKMGNLLCFHIAWEAQEAEGGSILPVCSLRSLQGAASGGSSAVVWRRISCCRCGDSVPLRMNRRHRRSVRVQRYPAAADRKVGAGVLPVRYPNPSPRVDCVLTRPRSGRCR